MRVKSLSEAFRGMAGVSLREPEAEVFSASLVTGAVTPKRGVFYVLPGTVSPLPRGEWTAVVVSGEVPPGLDCPNIFRSALPPEELLDVAEEILAGRARLDGAFARLISAAASGKGIEQLLESAYELVGNPMILVDTSYKLIACNREIADFREDIARQQQQGFMLSENIEEMKKERIYEDIRRFRYPRYSVQVRDGREVGWINALVYTDGLEAAQLGVPEVNRLFTAEDFEIIHFLCSLIGVELQKNDLYRQNLGQMHSVLLCDLLDGLIPDENTARLRADQLGWESGGPRCLLTVFDAGYGMFDRKARIISEKLHAMAPAGRWAFYENKVVFLLPQTLCGDEEFLSQLDSFFSNNGLVGACSAEFDSLLAVRAAYEQTLRAYALGVRGAPEARLHRYDDYVCRHIGQILQARGDLQSFCHPGVLHLAEADKKSDAKLIATLQAYLRHPDNPGAAAQALYIHKNTLFYRMHKIREEYGLSLSSGPERLWIQMTLEFLQI